MNTFYQNSKNKVRAKIIFPLHKIYFYTEWKDSKSQVDDMVSFYFSEKFIDNMNRNMSEQDDGNLEYLFTNYRLSKYQIKHIYLISGRNLEKTKEVLDNIAVCKGKVPEFPTDIVTNKYLRNL